MKHLRSPHVAFPVSVALLALVVYFTSLHMRAITEMRSTVMPLGAELVTLQHRADVLTEQVDLARESGEQRSGSAEEKVRAFVLPTQTSLPRLLSSFELLEQELKAKKTLRSLSSVNILEDADDPIAHDGLQTKRLTLTLVVTKEGATQAMSFLNLSGFVTVGDVLTPEELQQLFDLTEAHNAAGIVAIEAFLSSDLLAFIRTPRKVEQPVLQAFSSDAFLEQFHALLSRTRLSEARELLSTGFADRLASATLWPLQLMSIEDAALTPLGGEWYTMKLEVNVYGRDTK